MYVAVTRARDVLNVYVPLRYHHKRAGVSDRNSFAPISRFLTPIRASFDERADVATVSDFGEVALGDASVSVADEVDTITASLWQL